MPHKSLTERLLSVRKEYYIRKQRQCCSAILKCPPCSAVLVSTITLLFDTTRLTIIFLKLESYSSGFSFLLMCPGFFYILLKNTTFSQRMTSPKFSSDIFCSSCNICRSPILQNPAVNIHLNTMI